MLESGVYREIFRTGWFRGFWLGFTASAIGDAMTRVAFTWLVYDASGGSASALGVLTLCYTAPILAGGLAAGWLLDRFDRFRVIAVDNALRGAAVAAIPLLHLLGLLEVWHVYLAAAVYGALMMISLAGAPSIIPSLVQPRLLPAANALEMLGWTIAGTVGPAVAGVLIAPVGAANVVLFDAASYAAFALVVVAAGRHAPAPSPSATAGPEPPAGGGLGPAIRLLVSEPILLATTVMFLAANIGAGLMTVWLPVLVGDRLGGGPAMFGMLLAVLAVGETIGAVAAGMTRLTPRIGTILCAAQAFAGASLLAILAGLSLPVVIAALALFGAFSGPLTIWAQTLRMQIIPERLRGRTFALLRTLMQGGSPVGGALGGILVPLVSIPGAVALSGLLVLLPGVAGLRVGALRLAGRRLAGDRSGP